MEKEICEEKGNLGQKKVLGGDRQTGAYICSDNHPKADQHHHKANYQHYNRKEYNKEVDYQENNHHKTHNHKEANNNNNTKASQHNSSGIPSSYRH